MTRAGRHARAAEPRLAPTVPRPRSTPHVDAALRRYARPHQSRVLTDELQPRSLTTCESEQMDGEAGNARGAARVAPSSLPRRLWPLGAESARRCRERRPPIPRPRRRASQPGPRVSSDLRTLSPPGFLFWARGNRSRAGSFRTFSDKRTGTLDCSSGRGRPSPSPSALLDDPPLTRGHLPSSDTGQAFLRTSRYGQTAEAGPRGTGDSRGAAAGEEEASGVTLRAVASPRPLHRARPRRTPGGGKATVRVSQAPSDPRPELPG